MTDILNQIDATLAAAESAERNARRFHPSAAGEVEGSSVSACAMRWAPHGQDSIEEVPAPAEVAPPLRLADVAVTAFEMRRRTPEERRAYFAAERARRAADGAPEAWLASFDALAGLEDVTIIPADQFDELLATIDEPDDAPALRRAADRRRLTLADMEEASAAVRARREAAAGLDIELRRINDGLVEALSAGHTSLPWTCPRCRTEFSWDLPGLRRLHEANGCEPPDGAAPVPWWRRMLGGSQR